jgi:hypothetical protein
MATVEMSPEPVSGAGWDEDGYVVRAAVVAPGECAAILERSRSGGLLDRAPDVADRLAERVARLGATSLPLGAASAEVELVLPGSSARGWARPAVLPGGPAVVAYVALKPATLATGCPWVVPGSHRDPAPEPPRPPVLGAVPVPLAPGDVLVLDGRVLHRRTANHSIDTTATLIVAFHGPGG